MSDDQFDKLFERLDRIDQQLERHDERFDQLGKRLDAQGADIKELHGGLKSVNNRLDAQSKEIKALDRGLLGMYRDTARRFDDLEAKLESKADRDQVTQLLNAVDGIAGRLDTEELERAAVISQLDRHEEWIERAAGQMKIKYDHGASA